MAKQKTECTIDGELIVKRLLEERGMLMKDLAEMIGITREALTRALKGNPQYSTLKAISDGLGVSVPELFKKDHESSKQVKRDVHGCIYIDGIPHLITSKQDLEQIMPMCD